MDCRCIICPARYDRNINRLEHTLFDFLGGRHKTRDATCVECNNKSGSTIEKMMARDLEFIRNAHNFRSGDGASPPTLKKVPLDDGTFVDLKPGGFPDSRDIEMSSQPLDGVAGKTQSIRFSATSYDRLAQLIPNMARRYKTDVAAILHAIEEKGFSITRKRITAQAMGKFSISGAHTLCVSKMALVLWSTLVGNEAGAYLGSQEAGRAIYQTINGSTPETNVGGVDARPLETTFQLPEGFQAGDYFNLLYVYCDENGEVKGFFRLYNTFNYYVYLGHSKEHIKRSVLMISNPDTLRYETFKDCSEVISDAWFESFHFDEQEIKFRLAELHYSAGKRQLAAELCREIEEVFEEHQILTDDTPLTNEQAFAMAARITDTVLLRRGRELRRIIPGDEAKALIEVLLENHGSSRKL